MLTSTLLFLPLALTAVATPILSSRQSNPESTPQVTKATWDGQCFYPEPDNSFDRDSYLGRWYQLAGTAAPFTAGCSCIYAEYALNQNGTVNVTNNCQINNTSTTITGTATASNSSYGDSGVFQVQFPMQPDPTCPGPNYIVQDLDSDDGLAIVQASNFSTLFLLSRRPVVEDSVVERWLQRAGRLGSNLTEVVRTNQTGCVYT